MQSYSKQKTKPFINNKKLQLLRHSDNQMEQINEINEYLFTPSIQHYNFRSSVQQVNQPKIQKTTQLRQQINEQIEQQPRVTFNLTDKKQIQIVQKLNMRLKELQSQNCQLKIHNNELLNKIITLEQNIKELTSKINHINLYNQNTIKQNKTNQIYKQKLQLYPNDYQLHLQHSASNNKKSPIRKRLSKENSYYMGSPSISSSNNSRPKTTSTSPALLKELLLECNQSKEFQSTNRSIKTNNTHNLQSHSQKDLQKFDQFYEYKDTKDCFNPFFINLSRQLQLRCKKAMLREKELIYKDNFIEMGCITKKTDTYQFSITLIITNTHHLPLKNINVAYLHKKDIELSKQVKSVNLNVQKSTNNHTQYSELNSTQQIKQNLQILVHSVDFRCVLVSVEFQDHKGETHKIVQILPTNKHKLFTYLVPTPVPTNFISIQKVIDFDKKFLPELDKLKSYYKNVLFTTDRHQNQQALIKIEFINKPFFLTYKIINSDRLAIRVNHLPADGQLAQKVINELKFIFQK